MNFQYITGISPIFKPWYFIILLAFPQFFTLSITVHQQVFTTVISAVSLLKVYHLKKSIITKSSHVHRQRHEENQTFDQGRGGEIGIEIEG